MPKRVTFNKNHPRIIWIEERKIQQNNIIYCEYISGSSHYYNPG